MSQSESWVRENSRILPQSEVLVPRSDAFEASPQSQQIPRPAPTVPLSLHGGSSDVYRTQGTHRESSGTARLIGLSNEARLLERATQRLQTTLADAPAKAATTTADSIPSISCLGTLSGSRMAMPQLPAASLAASHPRNVSVADAVLVAKHPRDALVADGAEDVSEEWRDLAYVKCRVYRASFAAKLHDVSTKTALDF